MPADRCVAKAAGKQCQRLSIYGTPWCYGHLRQAEDSRARVWRSDRAWIRQEKDTDAEMEATCAELEAT